MNFSFSLPPYKYKLPHRPEANRFLWNTFPEKIATQKDVIMLKTYKVQINVTIALEEGFKGTVNFPLC